MPTHAGGSDPTFDAVGPRGGRKINVLFVDTTVFYGPLMQVHGRIMRHLDPRQFALVLLADRASTSPQELGDLPGLSVWRRQLGGRIASGSSRPARFGKRLAMTLTVVGDVIRSSLQARRERVDIVHAGMTTRSMLVGLMLSTLGGAILELHVHDDPAAFAGWKRRLARFASARAAAVIGVSDFTRRQLIERLGIDANKAWGITNAIETDEFRPDISGQRVRASYGIPSDSPVVLSLGRFVPYKGQLDLLRAINRLRAEAPELRALLIGWDDVEKSGGRSYRADVERYIADVGLGDTVIVDDARPDVQELIAAADILVVTAVNEPGPLTAIEAMATGRPVVGYSSGGLPQELGMSHGRWGREVSLMAPLGSEMLTYQPYPQGAEDGGLALAKAAEARLRPGNGRPHLDGDFPGLLVQPGDIEALAAAILRLARDPGLRRRMGEAGRRRAERRFYAARLAEDVTAVYDHVLGRGALAAAEANMASKADQAA